LSPQEWARAWGAEIDRRLVDVESKKAKRRDLGPILERLRVQRWAVARLLGVDLLDDAVAELEHEAAYYERRGGPNLRDAFLDELARVARAIVDAPRRFRRGRESPVCVGPCSGATPSWLASSWRRPATTRR
jgi:hypothetical protein